MLCYVMQCDTLGVLGSTESEKEQR
jgi:hypothetical protein